MEGELFDQLYHVVMQLARVWHKKPHVQFSDAWILLVFLWGALHDRPRCWACEERNWPAALLADRPLPSPACLSRRMRRLSMQLFFDAVMHAARAQLPDHLIKCIDAKPLVVGGYSKDRDAKRGRAANGFDKGYKLFAVYDGAGVNSWQIGPMNQAEVKVAPQLLHVAAREHGGGYLLGNSLYDSNQLYRLADEHGMQRVSRRQRPGGGVSSNPQHPARLRSIHLLESGSVFGHELYMCRESIEQRFGQAGNLGCGLGPLPNWVRRPHRVAMWVAAKLLILTCWNIQKQRLTA